MTEPHVEGCICVECVRKLDSSSPRLSYTADEMAAVVAERDRLVSALHNSRNLFTTMSAAAIIKIERLEKFVQMVREADAAKYVRGEVALVTAAIKWLDEQEKS